FGLGAVGDSAFESWLYKVTTPFDEGLDWHADRFDHLMSQMKGGPEWLTPVNAASALVHLGVQDIGMVVDWAEKASGSPQGSFAMIPFLGWESKLARVGPAAEGGVVATREGLIDVSQHLST